MSDTRAQIPTANFRLARFPRLLRRPVETLDMVLRGRDLVRLRVGPKKIYLVNHPDLIRQVLEGDYDVYARQGVEQTTERRLAGESVTTLDGADHAERWQILDAVFAGTSTDRDRERIVSCAHCLGSSWRDGANVELEREMAALTVEVMGSLVFGDDWTEVGESTRALVRRSREVALRAANPLAPLLWRLPMPATRRFDRAYVAFRSTVDRLIARRRAATAPGEDLLARLISARGAEGASLSDVQVRDEAWSYVAQGAPTYALLWIWWELTRERDGAGRVQQELDALESPPTGEQLGELRTTQAFVLETLRLYPTSLGALRRTRATTELAGATISAGEHVLISYWSTQRDARFWPVPQQFELGRWLDGEHDAERRYTYLPFSAGHRHCPARALGLAILVLTLATLAREWEVRVERESFSIGVVPFIHPRGALRATLRRRGQAGEEGRDP
jgi:cytochrome P450